MSDSYGCGGVLGSAVTGNGHSANSPYPIAKRDKPFSLDVIDGVPVIIHRKTGRTMAKGRSQVDRFFSPCQLGGDKSPPVGIRINHQTAQVLIKAMR